MRVLSQLLVSRNIWFPAEERRIVCLPHILNCCARHATEDYHKSLPDIPDRDWMDQSGREIDRDAYIGALRQNPIKRARQIVRAIRASSLRRETFTKSIQNGNEMKMWVNEEGTHVDIPEHELLRDVECRWDSIYTMISRLQEMRPVREYSGTRDACRSDDSLSKAVEHFFTLPTQRDLAALKLQEMDWLVLQDMELVLEVRCLFFLW